ncbi:hypothetical protein CWO28_05835 [Vibrio splendidus]|nr:hypothetical protein CWO28_05835 [Vibrio splendidus]
MRCLTYCFYDWLLSGYLLLTTYYLLLTTYYLLLTTYYLQIYKENRVHFFARQRRTIINPRNHSSIAIAIQAPNTP